MKYCSKCLYPARGINLNFDTTGICSACLAHDKYNQISDEEWSNRKKNSLTF